MDSKWTVSQSVHKDKFMMKVILIGTDHRIQTSVVQDETTKAWVPRKGGVLYRKLITYCIEKLGAKVMLEEAHPRQEQTAPTMASTLAKQHSVTWQTLGIGEPGPSDVLYDPPLIQAIHSGVKPELLAGIYDLSKHGTRERLMYATIMDAVKRHECVLAVVGFVHLGVLARMFDEEEDIAVEAFLFTYPLVVDETRT